MKFVRALRAGHVFTLALALAAAGLSVSCKKDDAKSETPPPPPPPPAASAAGPSVCAGGGGLDTDPISAPMIPRVVGRFCLDPQSEPKTYGDQGKLSMDQVCTMAFDGECEVYKSFGLERIVTLRYVDGGGAPSSVEIVLSRFKTPEGAYGMFTKRVIADGDPARASVKPLAAGAAGAMSSSNGYVWRGAYLVELTFVTEDANMTPEEMAHQNEQSTGAIAKLIGEALPAAPDLPSSARLLPAAARIPLGIAYYPKDAPVLAGVAEVAVGYYADGGKRWRDVAVASATPEAAREVFRSFKSKPGAAAIKSLGDEAVRVVLQEGADRPKAEYLVARKGARVVAVGDEELVLDSAAPADAQVTPTLSADKKVAKLREWLTALP